MWMYIELIRKFNACMLQWSNIELIIDELIKFWNERIKRWKNYKFNFKEDESLVFPVKRLMKTMKIMKRKQICEEMEGILQVNEIFASNTIYHNISMVKNKRNLYSFIPFFVLSPEKRNYHTNLSTIHLYDTFLTLHMFVKRSFSTRFFNYHRYCQ